MDKYSRVVSNGALHRPRKECFAMFISFQTFDLFYDLPLSSLQRDVLLHPTEDIRKQPSADQITIQLTNRKHHGSS